MNKQEFIEEMVTQYETRQSEPMPAHNKATLRAMEGREYDYWEGEEARTLNNNNRYRDDAV